MTIKPRTASYPLGSHFYNGFTLGDAIARALSKPPAFTQWDVRRGEYAVVLYFQRSPVINLEPDEYDAILVELRLLGRL